jgi:hypothetical protein
MKNLIILFVSLFTFLVIAPAQAGTKVVLEVEITQGDKVEKSTEIITYDEKRFRIDILGTEKKVTPQTPYIMTVDNGENWVIGDKPKKKFYCSKMQIDDFFKNIGTQVTDAIEFYNVTAEAPTVKKILEEPGPDILGFKTTHLQLETNAKAYAWIFFIKFKYTIKTIDDLWYTTDIEIHPVRKRWMNALSQSGNNVIDQLTESFTSKLPGPVLKMESVTDITNVRKKETKRKTQRSYIVDLVELGQAELDEVFQQQECITMDDDEAQEKAKALFSADNIIL